MSAPTVLERIDLLMPLVSSSAQVDLIEVRAALSELIEAAEGVNRMYGFASFGLDDALARCWGTP